MEVIKVANVHQALPEGCRRMTLDGVERNTRNGSAYVLPTPLSTVYTRPNQRVMFWEARDANPFFHLAECVWMLAGRNEVDWISQFSSNIANYSDDGKTFHGAYGYRWKRHFNFDQLGQIVDSLKANPECRRQVLSMWDPRDLLKAKFEPESKDLPCNTHAYFQINVNALDLMVVNRSNDMIWGAYGANAVHFSFLLEVIAAKIGAPVGNYTQVSMNTHLYKRHEELMLIMAAYAPNPFEGRKHHDHDPYARGLVEPYPVVETPWKVEHDCLLTLTGTTRGFANPFFPDVVLPMLEAFLIWKENRDWPDKRTDLALERLEQCRASDWKKAGVEWLERRRTP